MSPELTMVLRVLLAGLLGAIIGFERERAGKATGLRTHVLICFGAALFSVASIYGFVGAEPSRVAAGIVTGIGFLGAGAIFRRDGGFVEGLTTAATIWAVAGIGLAAGTGLYILAAAATAVVLAVLLLPRSIK